LGFIFISSSLSFWFADEAHKSGPVFGIELLMSAASMRGLLLLLRRHVRGRRAVSEMATASHHTALARRLPGAWWARAAR